MVRLGPTTLCSWPMHYTTELSRQLTTTVVLITPKTTQKKYDISEFVFIETVHVLAYALQLGSGKSYVLRYDSCKQFFNIIMVKSDQRNCFKTHFCNVTTTMSMVFQDMSEPLFKEVAISTVCTDIVLKILQVLCKCWLMNVHHH